MFKTKQNGDCGAASQLLFIRLPPELGPEAAATATALPIVTVTSHVQSPPRVPPITPAHSFRRRVHKRVDELGTDNACDNHFVAFASHGGWTSKSPAELRASSLPPLFSRSRSFCMAAHACSAGSSQVLPSQLYGVGLGLKRLSDGTLMVNK